jgi:hypothetical protein
VARRDPKEQKLLPSGKSMVSVCFRMAGKRNSFILMKFLCHELYQCDIKSPLCVCARSRLSSIVNFNLLKIVFHP